MSNHQYHLEKYHGRSSRHECPECHDPHSFPLYVDEDGNAIDESVGRCDHESRCGYHYTPKQWFRDHENKSMDNNQSQVKRRAQQPKILPTQPSYIPKEIVNRCFSIESTFIYFLCGLFDVPTIRRLMGEYWIGATKDGSVIFWQIDINGKVRTGKKIMYNPETGHRRKDGFKIDWIHSLMKRNQMIDGDFNLSQCLFGEHLLKRYPDRKVALVEAEKTAVIGSGFYPNFVWLATGGKSNASIDKLKVLRGRNVVMFPDVDAFKDWSEKAKLLTFANVMVSDLLEMGATSEDRDAKIDIADLLIRSSPMILINKMMDRNPAIKLLVDKMELSDPIIIEKSVPPVP